MTVAISTDAAQTGWLKIHILGNATAAGLVGQVLNPEGVLLQITEAYLYISTASTAASTFNIGITATSGADASDMMSAFAMNQTAGTVWWVIEQNAASEAAATTPDGLLWAATSYLTVTSAAYASTGLVADLFVKYIRLA
jgi:hypothetical protein